MIHFRYAYAKIGKKNATGHNLYADGILPSAKNNYVFDEFTRHKVYIYLNRILCNSLRLLWDNTHQRKNELTAAYTKKTHTNDTYVTNPKSSLTLKHERCKHTHKIFITQLPEPCQSERETQIAARSTNAKTLNTCHYSILTERNWCAKWQWHKQSPYRFFLLLSRIHLFPYSQHDDSQRQITYCFLNHLNEIEKKEQRMRLYLDFILNFESHFSSNSLWSTVAIESDNGVVMDSHQNVPPKFVKLRLQIWMHFHKPLLSFDGIIHAFFNFIAAQDFPIFTFNFRSENKWQVNRRRWWCFTSILLQKQNIYINVKLRFYLKWHFHQFQG